MLQLDHPFTLAACKSSPSSLRPEGPDPQPLLSQTWGSRPSHFTKCSLLQGWDFFTMLCSVSVAQTCYPISKVC